MGRNDGLILAGKAFPKSVSHVASRGVGKGNGVIPEAPMPCTPVPHLSSGLQNTGVILRMVVIGDGIDEIGRFALTITDRGRATA